MLISPGLGELTRSELALALGQVQRAHLLERRRDGAGRRGQRVWLHPETQRKVDQLYRAVACLLADQGLGARDA